ncbi:hypothetical protein BGZ80_004322 [Entomortierella chlamydospora]|uniref:N-acetyltransferase domain-containing protein n=1 Tax=Entomortierella chlamydospora TaxID=101097 RepID=A0A9P6MMD5_9FUNG|nr:hypothetical protein BGZ80_004322 [Entomortierella chlamydospora]
MPRSWSPPLDVNTRTITSVSVVRAKLEHLDAIHDIQLKAYKDREDFHESPEVFKAKLKSYPAGNFVAIVTSSVVTNDDTSTWVGKDTEKEEEEGSGEGAGVEEVQDDSAMDQDIETTNLTEETHIVRARTPDVVEGDDVEDEGATFLSSSTFKSATTLGVDNPAEYSSQGQQGHARESQLDEDEDDDEDFTTVLFQWDEPVGYLLSHPYSRESMRLHHVGGVGSEAATKTTTATEPSKTKKMRLEAGEETTDTESEEDPFDHDQLMEKYYIHDCAIHPDWRGKGLASRLWKALEESLTPASQNELLNKEGLVDTEEEDEGEEEEEASSSSPSTPAQTQKDHHPHRHRRHRKRSRKAHRRKGAPNLKEIVLVSVQGTRPFWERTAGFQVVTDHDMDLSGYGDEALLMRKSFIF